MSELVKGAVEGTNRTNAEGRLDEESGVQISLSKEHHEIHAGNGFSFGIVSLALAEDGEVLIQIQTGDNEVHLKELRVWGDSALASVELIEIDTITDGEDAMVLHQRNREDGGAAPADLLLFSDPEDIVSDVDLVDRLFGGGAGVGQTAFAGTDQTDREWVLAKNTDYVIRVINEEANPRNFSIDGFLYCG